MKIVVTGSLGHISKPLAEILVGNGHSVTVISSNPEKQKHIEMLGAMAAIGSIEDPHFLRSAFTGAEAAYCMIPPFNFFNPEPGITAGYSRIAGNYVQAIRQSGIKRVVHLSSIGAHTDQGTGFLAGHYHAEQILKELPPDITITHLRPASFYYNLYAFADTIKAHGFIASNYGAEDKTPWVSPQDIAEVAAEEITSPGRRKKIRYVVSDEPTCNEIAGILGAAIGRPDLKWLIISDEQMQSNLEAAGMPAGIAAGLVEMNAAMHTGALFEDYYRNRPPALGKIKISGFAKEFAARFALK
jgi:uncharacterized protein YbjT (DUF2867 family)